MFKALWLAAFYFANLLFLIRISLLIYAQIFRNTTRVKHELVVCFFIFNINQFPILALIMR